MERLCSICHLNNFKYTCPACGVQTCCIDCVKRHKKQTECTGTVDSTKFVSRNELAQDSSYMNRDYNFLMNVDRHIQLGRVDIKSNAKNVFKRQFGTQGRNKRFKPSTVEDKRINVVKKVFPHEPPTTTKRENTLVIQLPVGMERALSNKTGYDKKSGSFVWTIEWVYIGENGQELARFISYRLKEHLSLIEAIPLNILNNTKTETPIEKKDLLFYLHNVIKPDKATSPVISLDNQLTISSALKDKVILEYPTIYITTFKEVFTHTTSNIDEAYGITQDSSSSESSDSDSDTSDSSDESTDSDDEGPEESSSKLPEPIKFEDTPDQPDAIETSETSEIK